MRDRERERETETETERERESCPGTERGGNRNGEKQVILRCRVLDRSGLVCQNFQG